MMITRLLATIAAAAIFMLPSNALAGSSLIVSAAASLTDAYRDIGAAFEKDNPGCTVVFNFASSGALLQQMEAGAPVDVFASADMQTMEQAAASGLVVKESVSVFASNLLVLVQPADSKIGIKGPDGLLSAQVTRIAVGNPRTVPAGRYAKEALELAGVWDRIGGKLIIAENVRQVLDYVRRGEVDTGVVYATDAATARDMVLTVNTLKTASDILYPAAIASGGANRVLAEKFVSYLKSKKASAVFRKYGFGAPKDWR